MVTVRAPAALHQSTDLIEAIRAELLSRGGRARGAEVAALCPFHEERHPSFSFNVEKGVYHCHGCGAQGRYDRLAVQLGINIGPPAKSGGGSTTKIVATYDYRDERGELLFQVVRFEPKAFRQRRPDPTSRDG